MSRIWHEIAGSTAAGCATTIIGHPLDNIKVQLQTGNGGLRTSRQVLTKLVHNNALFRGIWPPLVNAVIMNTVMFAVFHETKNVLSATFTENTTLVPVMSGLVSGLATAIISTPTDYLKIQAQLYGVSELTVLRNSSFQKLYCGNVMNLLREGVFTMVYLGLYDSTMMRQQNAGLLHVMGVSCFTGGLAWIACYPFDTVKTVVQSEATLNAMHAYRKITKQHGVKGLFRGIQASLGRAILVTSLRMVVYEKIVTLSSGEI